MEEGIKKATKDKWYSWVVSYGGWETQMLGSKREAEQELKKLKRQYEEEQNEENKENN